MKSIDVIQEVKILPRVTASHRPGSEPHRQAETNVGSWGNQVNRPCIEPRKGRIVDPNPGQVTGTRDSVGRTPESVRREMRTVLACWNAIPEPTTMASRSGSHRGLRPGHVDRGMTRELVRASSFPVFERRGSLAESTSVGSPPRYQSSSRKGPTPQGRSNYKTRQNTGTTQRAGWRRRVGRTLGSLS